MRSADRNYSLRNRLGGWKASYVPIYSIILVSGCSIIKRSWKPLYGLPTELGLLITISASLRVKCMGILNSSINIIC